ncbi:hypothetical protein DIURU_004013 [Diutina rugosa]|uniref:mitogen-activated protein kinase kinase n=1 Tax=Diutina rugosa TaxID=5481 RepID=A0A642UN97_DIURU|nr:uncharacterized protein DIURU_004013 [Diutina rugosa]KAA8899972.1 hypothetical protein DIURU_004013 [Diutina rugosa]
MGDKQPNVSSPAPPPISSSMSSDIQARLLAFQKSRNPEAASPVGSLSRSSSMNAGRPPSAPPSDIGDAGIDAGVHIRPHANSEPQLPPTNPPLVKKPSLSQRRGMKLDMSELAQTKPIAPESKSDSAVPTTTNGNKRKFNLKLPSAPAVPQSPSKATNTDSNGNGAPSLFDSYKKYIDIQSGELKFAGKASLHSKGVDFSSGHSFRISLDELEYIEEIGRGNYGCVSKVLHKPTGVTMAMKEVRLELDETKFTQILMELDVLHRCTSPYIVDFYGAFFVEGAVYMCMEYMDGGSLDKIYGQNYGVQDEQSLAYISECVIRGLKELKDTHNIIHRDVKPTNILVNTQGKVKLCDFGVSGNLVASLAKTNIGCQSYMAPERIYTGSNPMDSTYSVQSDVWSLGITILEIACGHYPYPPETYGNIFSQLSAIVDGDPPKLDSGRFTELAQNFVNQCLQKNPDTRPSYSELLANPWLGGYKHEECEAALASEVNCRQQRGKSGGSGGSSVAASAPKPPQMASAILKKPVVAQGRRPAPSSLAQNRGFGR